VIVLDTNVISALMGVSPPAAVLGWLDRQPYLSLWITSITVYEIRSGLALLPTGRRRKALQQQFEGLVAEDLHGRVLDFDSQAANAAATLTARRQRAGQSIAVQDILIAGIATARRGTIATRNVRDFADLDVPVVNPWD
jgi:hypothetical protein